MKAPVRVCLLAVLSVLFGNPGRSEAGKDFKLDRLSVKSVGPIGLPSTRVDLVIVGDGYIKEDYTAKGKWRVDSARLIKNFFEKLPFKTHRHLFNVHLVEAVSLDRGADDSPDENVKRTPFNCCYGGSGIERLLVYRDSAAVVAAAENAPEVDMILVLVNDARFGGSGGKAQDIPAPVCSTQSTAFLMAIHELGHSFANLGDEYTDETVADKYPVPSDGDLPYPNLTLASYVDTTSPKRLIETLKWGHFFREPGAAKKYGKPYYEGGYYREKGVYRPAANCFMATEGGGGRFCYVCLHEMEKAIYRCCGRGPTGNLPVIAVGKMEGRLEKAYRHYVKGELGKTSSELKKVEKEKASAADQRDVERLRRAMEKSLEKGFVTVDDLLKAGQAEAAREHLNLMTVAFKGTEWYSDVRSRKKDILSDPTFKREVKAQAELQKIVAVLRGLGIDAMQRRAIRKRIEKFAKKHSGTKAAEKARKLAADL